ncbi:MAG: TetR family transcriptional regulator, partial [Dermatophilaceae bacterium]
MTSPAGAEPVEGRRGTRGSQRAALSRDRVLQAALQVVDTEGLHALTMRRLGRQLDRDPMTLYRYAANREALLDGVAELVLAHLVIPTDVPDWARQLRTTAHQFRQLALNHPNVVPLLVTRPLRTPLGLRPLGTIRPLEQMPTPGVVKPTSALRHGVAGILG